MGRDLKPLEEYAFELQRVQAIDTRGMSREEANPIWCRRRYLALRAAGLPVKQGDKMKTCGGCGFKSWLCRCSWPRRARLYVDSLEMQIEVAKEIARDLVAQRASETEREFLFSRLIAVLSGEKVRPLPCAFCSGVVSDTCCPRRIAELDKARAAMGLR